jgi:hypothetical protein
MAESIKLLLPNGEAKYFCGRHWTANSRTSLTGKSGRPAALANDPFAMSPLHDRGKTGELSTFNARFSTFCSAKIMGCETDWLTKTWP